MSKYLGWHSLTKTHKRKIDLHSLKHTHTYTQTHIQIYIYNVKYIDLGSAGCPIKKVGVNLRVCLYGGVLTFPVSETCGYKMKISCCSGVAMVQCRYLIVLVPFFLLYRWMHHLICSVLKYILVYLCKYNCKDCLISISTAKDNSRDSYLGCSICHHILVILLESNLSNKFCEWTLVEVLGFLYLISASSVSGKTKLKPNVE